MNSNDVTIAGFQGHIAERYEKVDRERGTPKTFIWFIEEIGELARSIRGEDPARQRHEAGDVLAWLASVANLLDVDLEEAVSRYASGCPRCGDVPCSCPMR